MKQRPFTRDGTTVSEVGLGAWQLGGDCWGQISDESATAILAAAVDHGVTFIDTADVYGTGRSETLIGRFLKQRSEKLFVATKIGRFPDPGWPDNFSFDVFERHTEASLRRLGVDSLDLVQLHCIPMQYYRQGDVFDWLRKLQDKGKIQRFGASVESMDEASVCLQQPGLASLQIIFNIFRQKPITTIFEQAQAAGVALIARLPLASGLLAGKFTKQTTFPDNDHRRFNRDGQRFNVGETFAGLPFEKGVDLANEINPWVPPGMTMPALALRWILDHDAISTIIPGASSPAQAESNALASDLSPLTPDLHATLGRFYTDHVAPHIRGPY